MGKYKIIALVVVAFLILAVIGGYNFLKSRSLLQEEVEEPEQVEEQKETIRELNAEDIGLTLTLRADKKGLIMKITKLDGISSIEYEGTYDAEVKEAGETLKVVRGIGPSTIQVKTSEKQILRDDLIFGTCSRNVCKYDQGVIEVDFVIKVNYENGEVGSIQQIVEL